ncbi:MAG TPA: dihydrolipoamide acetyltransferase family protein [Bosea sp. (in: a-proteobacteria)]|jgi:pyruvate dehydrogenase E2 component (dihydrolipoamide acetyltransferase)|uniref:dihydrolipoamide acetyltransferase family protein n=1 Tax=Bosea sp. (in: a-proteobacteria) TaxID=1871050 RepID=UPI002E112E33|nr:dihydrolipoamide acetyltransferase family protein [Bosea sp. (in: a-proteobacteria)]
MPVEVILPKVDMDMETGTIEAWHVKEGDQVRQGETIFEIGTNKAVMEVEAPASGAIRRIRAETGIAIAVGTPVAWIYLDGETQDAAPAAKPAAMPAPPPATAAAVVANQASNGVAAGAVPVGLRATPLARRVARQNGIDLRAIAGSGPRGRIGEADVRSHIAAVAAPAPVAVDGAAATCRSAEAPADTLKPFSAIRRIVATRLSESMRTAPHFYLTSEIEMSAAQALLRRLAARHERLGAPKPSLTVLIARIAAGVLGHHPLLNASAEGEATRFHERIDIGIAMEREGDLVVPVLRDAGTMDMPAMAREFARLREGVAKRSLTPAELGGGTFTISNLGMYGVDSFTAIINPPQGAILAVGRTVEKPVGRDGQIVLRPMANFTLSSDHRIIDGVTAARFMADLREALENPEVLL